MTNPTPEQIEAALGYIDKTIDNCQDLPPDLKWGNLEVLGMLGQVRAELVAAAGVTPQPEGLLERVADTLAYYQCRETNPKADHPRMGYHAFSEEQRAHLREQKAEAAAEIARMMGAGVTPQEPDRGPKDMSIMNGWLVEAVGEHTCGAGADGYGHEPGCGYVPVLNLAELDGYPPQVDEAKLADVIWGEQESRVLDGYVIHTRETAATTARTVDEWLRGGGQ